jgi:hypothetical protein
MLVALSELDVLLNSTVVIEQRPPEIPQNRKLGGYTRVVSTDERGSTTSEMSGHDSESIYETIRVFTPKKQGEYFLFIR